MLDRSCRPPLGVFGAGRHREIGNKGGMTSLETLVTPVSQFLALIAVLFIKGKPLKTQSGMERLAEENPAAAKAPAARRAEHATATGTPGFEEPGRRARKEPADTPDAASA
ncbi:hypothetical protein ACFYWN_42300 [Streptomyces sp. NPDC002917]|uniref:hypothetical protein n=1 Tax=Streptomyces sp. NPDC002917 TaxID=3364671 RepID=UPI0036C83172